MKLLKYNVIFIYLLTGCSISTGIEKAFWSEVWGDSEKRNEKYTTQDINKYCTDKGLKSCDLYSKCFMRNYSTFPGVVRNSTVTHISWSSGCAGNNEKLSNKCLMDNIYNTLKDFENKGNTVSISYAYILYAHNSCSLVSGDKKYNIDEYDELIKTEIKCGKSRTLARYENNECLNNVN